MDLKTYKGVVAAMEEYLSTGQRAVVSGAILRERDFLAKLAWPRGPITSSRKATAHAKAIEKFTVLVEASYTERRPLIPEEALSCREIAIVAWGVGMKLAAYDRALAKHERELVTQGKTIEAIKTYRTRTGADLRTAKEVVDAELDREACHCKLGRMDFLYCQRRRERGCEGCVEYKEG